MRKGICRDIYDTPCSKKDEIQEVLDGGEYICSECGEELESLPKQFHEKGLFKGIVLSGLMMGGFTYWYTLPDTMPPSKPTLLNEVLVTDKNKTSLEVSGEKGAKVFVNGLNSNQVIDENGEVTLKLDTSYAVGQKKVFTIYLQDDANNSSEKIETTFIEKVKEPDNHAPLAPRLLKIPTVVINDKSGLTTVDKTIKVKGEINSAVFLNGEDTGKKILSNGIALIKVKITNENIDEEFFLKLVDESGNSSEMYSFVFEKEIEDTTSPEKPEIDDLPTTTSRDITEVEIIGEELSRVFVNNKFSGQSIKDGLVKIELDTKGEIGEKKDFSIFLKDQALNKSETLEFTIEKVKAEDIIPPKKPIVLSDISNVFYCDTFSLELKGEPNSRIYINNKDIGSMNKKGRAIFPLDISQETEFKIFLEDTSKNKNRSEVEQFSIKRHTEKQFVTAEGVNFAFVPSCKQEVNYLLDPYIKYSNDDLSIYTDNYISLQKPIYMQTTPVTIKQFEKFIKENDTYTADGIKDGKQWSYKVKTLSGEHFNNAYPVANVSLQDIEQYIEWFNEKTGYKHRLPTVEEWVMSIHHNFRDAENYTRRQKVDTSIKEVSQFVANLYEFSSTSSMCEKGVLLLGSSYETDIKKAGKRECEHKLNKFISFRLVREID